jgi:hypothetical protein
MRSNFIERGLGGRPEMRGRRVCGPTRIAACAFRRPARRGGQQTKMKMIYRYLTGPRFNHRIEAVVERFAEMQADRPRTQGDDAPLGEARRADTSAASRRRPSCTATCKASLAGHCRRLRVCRCRCSMVRRRAKPPSDHQGREPTQPKVCRNTWPDVKTVSPR